MEQKNYFGIFNNYKDRNITMIITWRLSYQNQVKIDTFMPDTKHKKCLRKSVPRILNNKTVSTKSETLDKSKMYLGTVTR